MYECVSVYDVVGAVRQEQLVQYIQHISPVHSTNGGRGQCPSSDKSVGAFTPMAPVFLHHYVYNTQSSYMHEKCISDVDMTMLRRPWDMSIQWRA